MYTETFSFTCDHRDCSVEKTITTRRRDKTPPGWSTVEISILGGEEDDACSKEISCRQHLCPKHTQELAARMGDTGWRQNLIEVTESPLKEGANPQPLYTERE